MLVGLIVGHSLVFDEIGEDECNRPRDASHAMDQDVGFLQGFMDEVDGGVEVHAEVVVLVVLSWYV